MNQLTPEELKKWMDAGEDFQLVDVRERYEYELSNLSGDLIPLQNIPEKIDEISKDKKVVLMCRSGGRSANAAMYLERHHGLDNLYNLMGGILAYSDEVDDSVVKY